MLRSILFIGALIPLLFVSCTSQPAQPCVNRYDCQEGFACINSLCVKEQITETPDTEPDTKKEPDTGEDEPEDSVELSDTNPDTAINEEEAPDFNEFSPEAENLTEAAPVIDTLQDTSIQQPDTAADTGTTVPDTVVLPDTTVQPDTATLPDTALVPDTEVPDTAVEPDTTVPDSADSASVPDTAQPDETDAAIQPDSDTTPPDPCAASPCTKDFDFNATCQAAGAAYTCQCSEGFLFTGGSCKNINECTTNNGGCAQNCIDATGSYHCSCAAGYTLNADGKNCDDINECTLSNPCNDQGDAAAQCSNTPAGSYTCVCSEGFDLSGGTCVNINECLIHNGDCDMLTQCTDTLGGRTCGNCPSGYTGNGETGCTDIAECSAGNPCDDQGDTAATCIEKAGSFDCSCSAGYQFLSNTCSPAEVVQIGSDTKTDKYPLGVSYDYVWAAAIYLSSEINKAGGGSIRKLAWYTTLASPVSREVNIYLKQVTASVVSESWTWTSLKSGATLVYSGTLAGNAANVWTGFALSTPFTYNGTSNLLIMVESNSDGSGYYSHPGTRYTEAASERLGRITANDNAPNSYTLTADDNIPNIQIIF